MNFTKVRLLVAALIVLVLILLFRSCSDNTQRTVLVQQPQTQQQVQMEREYIQNEPNVVVVQQPPQTVYHSGGGIDAGHLAAGALGYMAGRSSNSRSYSNNTSRPVVTNKYYTKKVYVNKPSKKFYGSSSTKRYKRR